MDSRPSTTSSVSISKIPAVSPLPPILKKPDAPPPSGPRPSVGFASPAGSDVEADDEVGEASSATTRSHSPGEPVPTDSQISKLDKKGKKKSQPFVASRGGKKRPTIVRRSSSKSSAEFKSGLPQSNVISSSTEGPPLIETPSKGKGKEKVVTVSRFQENFSVSPEKVLKKPKASKSTNGKGRSESKEHYKPSTESIFAEDADPATLRRFENINPNSNGDPGPSTVRNMQTMQRATGEEDLTIAELEELEMQKVMFKDFERQKLKREKAVSRAQPTGSKREDLDLEVSPSSQAPQRQTWSAAAQEIETPNTRITSGGSFPLANTPEMPRDTVEGRRTKEKFEKVNSRAQPEAAGTPGHTAKTSSRSQPLKSKSSTTISKNFASATGQLDIGSAGAHCTGKEGNGEIDDMFAKRPIPSLPTGPSALSASVPSAMARSKSQLSMLLEKDRVRSGEKENDRDGKKKKAGSTR